MEELPDLLELRQEYESRCDAEGYDSLLRKLSGLVAQETDNCPRLVYELFAPQSWHNVSPTTVVAHHKGVLRDMPGMAIKARMNQRFNERAQESIDLDRLVERNLK